MTLQSVARQRIIKMLDELPSEILPEVIKFLEFLRFKTGRNGEEASQQAEAALLETINRRLPPEDQRRLSLLRRKAEMDKLTAAEHKELLAYVERVEIEDARRAEAIVQLAQVRNVPVTTFLQDFSLESADAT